MEDIVLLVVGLTIGFLMGWMLMSPADEKPTPPCPICELHRLPLMRMRIGEQGVIFTEDGIAQARVTHVIDGLVRVVVARPFDPPTILFVAPDDISNIITGMTFPLDRIYKVRTTMLDPTSPELHKPTVFVIGEV